MIRFHNGYDFDFGCAAGALGFDGNGYWWEQPWRWLKILRPEEMTIITKTLTSYLRKGNYNPYAPWRTFRKLKGGFLNALGMPNPGLDYWIYQDYHKILRKGYTVILSLFAEDVAIAARLAMRTNNLVDIKGIQLNLSCPNTATRDPTDYLCELANKFLRITYHPLILKLGYQQNFLAICKEFDNRVAAFELINTVPFNYIYPTHVSPLSKYNLEGGVSGFPIQDFARDALIKVKRAGIHTPIISGGGINSLQEVYQRESLGAKGFVFGSIFLTKPWVPNQIIQHYRRKQCHENTLGTR